MKRKAIIIAVLTLCGLSCYFLWASSSVREGLDPDNDFVNWAPSAAAIQKSLPAGTLAERQEVFRALFENRFRKHEPGKAIGIRFQSDGTLSLLTPARLEPWHIDKIAMMLYRETRQDFGKNYEINIYETFIGTAKIKIGELRPLPNTPEQMSIVYRYPRTELILLRPAVQPNGNAPRPMGAMGYPKRPRVVPMNVSPSL